MFNGYFKIYLILFLGILIPMNIVGHWIEISWLTQFTKPLLMPVLTGYFVNRTRGYSSRNKIVVLVALLFSWVGDVALMFDDVYPIFFIIGLGGFLLAHVNYVYALVRTGHRIHFIGKGAWIGVPFIVLYGVGLLSVLWPHLDDLRMPVFLYAVVLMLMGGAALIRKVKIGYYMVLLGAILFILSDSMLAINKFVQPIEKSGVLIMSTYMFAQLFIVLGLSNKIISQD